MNEQQSKATSVKYFLIFVITLLIIGLGGGVYFAQNYLNEKATSIIKESIDQSDGADKSAQLINVLNANKIYIDKAAELTTTDKNYRQRVEKDLQLYANSTGVSIKEIEMDVNYKTEATFLQSNLQERFIKVTFNNPVAYSGFIKFLRAVETNLPKMQLMGLGIEGSVGSQDAIDIKPIFIKVYLR